MFAQPSSIVREDPVAHAQTFESLERAIANVKRMLRRDAQTGGIGGDNKKFIHFMREHFTHPRANDGAIGGECDECLARTHLADRNGGPVGAQNGRVRQEAAFVVDQQTARQKRFQWRDQKIVGRARCLHRFDGLNRGFP